MAHDWGTSKPKHEWIPTEEMHPPYGIMVDFILNGRPDVLHGYTASLGDQGVHRRIETVFVSVIGGQREVHLCSKVGTWREAAFDRAAFKEFLDFLY